MNGLPTKTQILEKPEQDLLSFAKFEQDNSIYRGTLNTSKKLSD